METRIDLRHAAPFTVRMKLSTLLPFLIFAIAISGCASKKAVAPPAPVPVVVTPDNSLSAKVVSCNDAGRFVILNFSVGELPRSGQTLFLYRDGLKVGEVKVNADHRNNYVVADLVNGDAKIGDDVREQ